MCATANQGPDFHYNVNDSHQKLTVWVGLCGKCDMLRPSYLMETLMDKVIKTF